MAKIVQTRRGSVEQHIGFDGQQGEVTFDLSANTLRVHDGSTFPADQPSGYPLARADMSNVFNSIGIEQLDLPDGTPGQFLTTDGAGSISFTTIDTGNTDFDLGGDLSGTISVAQINANTIGGNELNIGFPPTNGYLLTMDTDGTLGFMLPQTEFTLAGDVNGPLGNNFLATNTVSTNNIIDLNVTTEKLEADAVTAAKLADNAVLNTNIVDGTITGAKIGAGQINSSHIAADIIIAEDIAANAITIAELQDGAVIENKIANNAVTSNKIANNAVGITQLSVQADGNAGEFLQTNGSGVLSFATAASTLTGGTSFQGIAVFRALKETPNYGEGDNIEQTYTIPAGVQSILYFITAAGDSGASSNGGGPGQAGVTLLGHLDVSNITSLQLRVGTGGRVTGSVSNLPQTGPGYSSYLGDLVITGTVTSTANTEATGTIATAFQGTAAIGGDLVLPAVSGNSFWPGVGQGGPAGVAQITQCSSGGGSFSTARPGGVGEPGLIVILEFG